VSDYVQETDTSGKERVASRTLSAIKNRPPFQESVSRRAGENGSQRSLGGKVKNRARSKEKKKELNLLRSLLIHGTLILHRMMATGPAAA